MSQRKTRKGAKRSMGSMPTIKIANHSLRVASTEERNRLTALHRRGDFEQVRNLARQIVEKYPDDAYAWTVLGSSLLKLNEYEEALQALSTADSLFPHDHLILDALARAHALLGNHQQAIIDHRRCLELAPEYAPGHFHLAALLSDGGDAQALEHLDKAEALGYSPAEVLLLRGSTQSALFQFNAALTSFRKLLEIAPDDPFTQNDIANTYKDMGDLQKSEAAYRKALELNPKYATAYSNLFFTMHYDPERTPESILAFAKEWEKRFAPSYRLPLLVEADLAPNKRLRVGLLSSGMRLHPVGQMITAALEHLDDSFELYAYSTNNAHDAITERIRQTVTSWQSIGHLSEEQLAKKIRQDNVDILIDMSGHSAGNRLRTIAMRPAPIAVKWVGGLVGSMGLTSFDYLLSDAIETPPGVDHLYVEKLIRMPDDYICYLPPDYLPPITVLPAIVNGYVILGCFNNPAKINPVLLAEWATLMHQLPNSRLLLKGAQYDSPEFCERIRGIMREHGIADERLMLEGPSTHRALLEAYNRIDIALDPWPYSGGLTTCEAMLMGVPVVTLPGPTFAGRHSATHLVNAGMPELVVDSWDQYRQRVIELATDLPNLSVIRACLRRVLMESPVCDGPRFARHFTTAMRAIWQRHCAGKPPAALSLDKDGSACFEGEAETIKLVPLAQTPAKTSSDDSTFQWSIEGKIITLDHGAVLTTDPIFADLQKLGIFATIAFDPTGKISNAERLQKNGELYHYPHVALGDGKEATLFSCADPTMNATLEPLNRGRELPEKKQASQVVARNTIPSLRLDDIDGLENIDWLLLDNMSASLTILENGKKALMNTLLIQARVNFVASHQQQPELAPISLWLTSHGFSLYRLNNLSHTSCFPPRDDLLQPQATQLAWADALFLPNEQRMGELPDNQRQKLAFLLHQVYGVKDLTYRLLATASPKIADNYLRMEGLLAPEATAPGPERAEGDPEVSVICATYNHRNYIEDAIKGFLAQKTDFKFEIIIHDDASTDGTQEIVTRYAEQYPELIRVILQTENQYSKNRKPADICLPKTKGRYIAMCEGDDYWVDPEKLQKQYDFMEANPNYSCCYHDAFIFNEVGIVSSSKLPKRYRKDYTRSELLLNNCFILTLSIFFRKTFSEYPKEKGQVGNGDNFLISMLGLYGKGKYLPDIAPAAYRLHGDSTWSSKSLKEKNEMLRNSFTWIAHYHHREGRPDIADHYHKKAALLID